MNIKDFKVGEKVIMVFTRRDYVEGGIKEEVEEGIVQSVGKKFVYVVKEKAAFSQKYSFESVRYQPHMLVDRKNEANDILLFRDLKEYELYKNTQTLRKNLRQRITVDHILESLSYEQLQKIEAVLNETQKA